MNYEILTPQKVPYLVALCKELHAQGAFRTIPFVEEHNFALCMHAAQSPDWYVCFAKDDTGMYVGFVAGTISPLVFSPRLVGVENAWYVREGTPARGKTACYLMKSFVRWCMIEKQCVHVQAGDVANINSTAVDALYRVLGFKRMGTVYHYREGV